MNIPPSLIPLVGQIFAKFYTHDGLDALFSGVGFPSRPPIESSKVVKCEWWMRLANRDCKNPLKLFGALIAEFMDSGEEQWRDGQEKIQTAMEQEGLVYRRGGVITRDAVFGPSQSLAERLEQGGDGAEVLKADFDRACEAIDSDPAAAVTAACAILESLCKTFLESSGVPLPSKKVLKTLWPETAKHLGLQPGQLADDDLKRILQGLNGVFEGIAALRTHEGSAHGRSGYNEPGKTRYKISPRHARLAVHAAHTAAMFVWETWEQRKSLETENAHNVKI